MPDEPTDLAEAPRPAPAARPTDAVPANLSRHAPLVPVDTAAARSLIGVIAILTFLAALCAAGAELVAAGSAEWRAAVSREATIQVRPDPQRSVEADVARAADIARRAAGVAEVRAFSQAESERLLEPWLGSGLDLGDLPVPRLVVLRLAQGARPDLAALRRALSEAVPGASLDDHGAWLARLSTMATTVVAVGVGLVLLVLAAAGLAVAFATRGAMASNREVVEVLHFVGADDETIAREFQRGFFRLGLKGGGLGALAALAFVVVTGIAAGSWRASAVGDQIEALFGTFDLGWRSLLVALLVALLVSGVTGIVSRLTVRRYLQDVI